MTIKDLITVLSGYNENDEVQCKLDNEYSPRLIKYIRGGHIGEVWIRVCDREGE